MGIDIHMRWKGQTRAEEQEQITGFSVNAGRVGYLREAYHGAPYVTRYLCAEAFEAEPEPGDDDWKGPPIPAAVLRERLPVAVMLAIYRDYAVYGEGKNPALVNLGGEVKEGEVPKAMLPHLAKVFDGIATMREGAIEGAMAERTTPEQIKTAKELIEKRTLPDYCLSFVDFVRLAELKEAETGEPVKIYASY